LEDIEDIAMQPHIAGKALQQHHATEKVK